ncbi:MAG: hypothetical protein AAF393_18950 [Pseudomonadota bacterium]
MFKAFRILATFVVVATIGGSAVAGPKFSWFFWGEIRSPEDLSKPRNAKLELYLRPEITLHRWGDRADLVAYAIISGFRDQRQLSYNNKTQVFLGVEGRYQISDAVRLKFGVRFGHEDEFNTAFSASAAQLTFDAEIWQVWTPKFLTRNFPQNSRIVMSGWADFRYPASLHPFDKKNGLGQASVKLALDVPIAKSRVRVAPFVQMKTKMDLKKRVDLNYIAPAVGLDFKFGLKQGEVSIGVKAVRQIRLGTLEVFDDQVAYVSWYKRF